MKNWLRISITVLACAWSPWGWFVSEPRYLLPIAAVVPLFVAPLLLGARGGTPLLDLAAAAEAGLGRRVEGLRRLVLDDDLLLLGNVACSPD